MNLRNGTALAIALSIAFVLLAVGVRDSIPGLAGNPTSTAGGDTAEIQQTNPTTDSTGLFEGIQSVMQGIDASVNGKSGDWEGDWEHDDDSSEHDGSYADRDDDDRFKHGDDDHDDDHGDHEEHEDDDDD